MTKNLGQYPYSYHDSIIHAVEIMALDPDLFKEFKKQFPFNDNKFKDFDWTSVSSAEFNDNNELIIEI